LWVVETRPWSDIAVARGRVVTADADVTSDVQELDQIRVQVARDVGLTPVEAHALIVVPEDVPALRLEGVVIVGRRLVRQIIVSPGRRLTGTQLEVLERRTSKVLSQAANPEPPPAARVAVVPSGAPAGPYQAWWDAPGPASGDHEPASDDAPARPTPPSERSEDRVSDRFGARSPERTTDRISDRFGERSPERIIDPTSGPFGDRSGDRTSDRFTERSGDRISDRFGERSPERSADRASDRFTERSGDRISDRFGERSPERTSGPFGERSTGRASDRFGERSGRASDRFGERPSDRFGERSSQRFLDFPPEDLDDGFDDYDEAPPPLPTPEELGLPPALVEPARRRPESTSDPIWPIAPPPGTWPEPEPEPELAQLVAHSPRDVDEDPQRTRVVQSAWPEVDDDDRDLQRTRVVDSAWPEVDEDEDDMGRTRVVDYPSKPLVSPSHGTPRAKQRPRQSPEPVHEPVTEEAVAAFERDWENLSRQSEANESLAGPLWGDDDDLEKTQVRPSTTDGARRGFFAADPEEVVPPADDPPPRSRRSARPPTRLPVEWGEDEPDDGAPGDRPPVAWDEPAVPPPDPLWYLTGDTPPARRSVSPGGRSHHPDLPSDRAGRYIRPERGKRPTSHVEPSVERPVEPPVEAADDLPFGQYYDPVEPVAHTTNEPVDELSFDQYYEPLTPLTRPEPATGPEPVEELSFDQYYEPVAPVRRPEPEPEPSFGRSEPEPVDELSFDQYYEPVAPVRRPEPEPTEDLPFVPPPSTKAVTEELQDVPFDHYYDPVDVVGPAEPVRPDQPLFGWRPGDGEPTLDRDVPFDLHADALSTHEPDRHLDLDDSFDDNYPTISRDALSSVRDRPSYPQPGFPPEPALAHDDGFGHEADGFEHGGIERGGFEADRFEADRFEAESFAHEPDEPADQVSRPDRYVRPTDPRPAGRYVRDDDEDPFGSHDLADLASEPARTGGRGLTPDQTAIVTTRFAGPVRIRGAFGTGRSVAVAHRAVHLAETRPGVVAVIVPSAVQVEPMRRRLAAITPAAGRIVVDVPAGIAVSVLAEFGTEVTLAAEPVARAWAAAQRATGLGAAQGGSIGLVRDEVAVIRGHDSMSEGGYHRLRQEVPSGLRHHVWMLHEAYQAELHRHNLPDEHDLVRMARAALRAGVPSQITSAVVDDANDLSPAQLSMICEIVGTGADALMLADDGLPGLPPVGAVLAEAGIDIADRQFELTHEFRLTGPAWTSLVRLLQPDTGRDLTGVADRPRLSGKMDDGEGPAYLRSPSAVVRRDKLVERVVELISTGVAPEAIALLHIDDDPEPELVSALVRAGIALRPLDALDRPGVAVGRARDSRGVEYDHVLVPDARHRDVVPVGGLRWDQRQRRRLLGLALSRSHETAWIAGV